MIKLFFELFENDFLNCQRFSLEHTKEQRRLYLIKKYNYLTKDLTRSYIRRYSKYNISGYYCVEGITFQYLSTHYRTDKLREIYSSIYKNEFYTYILEVNCFKTKQDYDNHVMMERLKY